ncbi:hypothetical protein Nepgr_004061 [Nepenthes gracilis]|uniref:Uncharacterized protein n=1 Tax=Nepenthes gracilis TaxID=150966 RepID=A0AAD3S0P2_NEPGR|nr:hypothetical protein Nepgr_004061 [Nepenthes gracilis]
MGVIFESLSPPSLHSEYARSTLLAELPVSVVVDGAPQETKTFSILCSEDLGSGGRGNCLASPCFFPVGSLPVFPSPSLVGGLDAGVSPMGSSSPPRLNVPCTSSVMSPVSSTPTIPPASCGALPLCPEVPKNSPAATHPRGADADNHGVSWSSVVQQNTPSGKSPLIFFPLNVDDVGTAILSPPPDVIH